MYPVPPASCPREKPSVTPTEVNRSSEAQGNGDVRILSWQKNKNGGKKKQKKLNRTNKVFFFSFCIHLFPITSCYSYFYRFATSADILPADTNNNLLHGAACDFQTRSQRFIKSAADTGRGGEDAGISDIFKFNKKNL